MLVLPAGSAPTLSDNFPNLGGGAPISPTAYLAPVHTRPTQEQKKHHYIEIALIILAGYAVSMPRIDVSPETDQQLSLLASWEGTSKGEVVARLLAKLSSAETEPDNVVAVHKIYEKERIEGFYDPASSTLTITSPPWSGEVFSKPSSAAIAVVQHFKPDTNPNRNGWDFWRVTESGATLQSLRTHR